MEKQKQVYRVQMLKGQGQRKYVGVLASSEAKAMRAAQKGEHEDYKAVSAIIEDGRPVTIIGD